MTDAQKPDHVSRNSLIGRLGEGKFQLDPEYLATLDGILEYTDLRGLQDVIASPPLWPKFVGLFANKETLNAKFGQLAGLRNTVAHSRTVNEVTRKESEAALIWFDRILKKQERKNA